MPSTYTPIASTTLSSAAQITFSSIPATYTDLVLVVVGTVATNGNGIVLQFNSDTGNNYSSTQLYGNLAGSSLSARITNRSAIPMNWNTGFSDTTQSIAIANIMNYSNTNVFTTMISRSGNPYGTSLGGTELLTALWRNTAAISTIKIFDGIGNLPVGFTATLYGIKAA